MAKVFVQSFGCRASQADGAAIDAALAESGFESVTFARDADLVVLNTCTVTHSADVDARRIIRGVHREHPNASILVTGCYAQRAPEEIAAMEGVRWVVGNSHKASLASIVAEMWHARHEEYHGQIFRTAFEGAIEFKATPVRDVREDRTRPNLKVQDGCSNRCSFCIIPAVRGRSRSAPLDEVVQQVNDLASRYAELVLSGINLGRWGRDLPGRLRFVDLLRAVLDRSAVKRLRVSSVEPMDWSDELIEIVGSENRIAKHVHLPLQSGSDAVLKRMFRKYRTRHYAARLERVMESIPDAAIGADVMTGFPGETDVEFQETIRFIEQQPFTYLHVFTYSERPGTAAASLPGTVPVAVRRERTNVLRQLSTRKNEQFRRSLVGRRVPAVTLEERGAALTTNFVRVQMSRFRDPNELLDLDIDALSDTGLRERGALPVLA
ncbi:MAG: tRNA (N(6)-L-threonylcarbamoyladenosine(37)-C(2))-methylthiotransferase MtaB [Acidobacteriaceae bacterium]|nr:tRNA (N(6)-L-threonylcarbamoyladenosine(37)-C(2))-methylthiotransferase MtaB [Acidobacteriaceae bacterium]